MVSANGTATGGDSESIDKVNGAGQTHKHVRALCRPRANSVSEAVVTARSVNSDRGHGPSGAGAYLFTMFMKRG